MSDGVEAILHARFPRLRIFKTDADKAAAIAECDFCLHGSGPSFVAAADLARFRRTGKPYGIGGITLSDPKIRDRRELLEGAKFVFCRDTASLAALKASGLNGPRSEFGPDATFFLDVRDDAKAEAFLP